MKKVFNLKNEKSCVVGGNSIFLLVILYCFSLYYKNLNTHNFPTTPHITTHYHTNHTNPQPHKEFVGRFNFSSIIKVRKFVYG